jgi:TATA-box binding protein (TBP) (component of TFIID and TFIIIB)
MNIDKEWENFISSGYEDDISSDDDSDPKKSQINEEFVSADVSIELDCSKTPKASDIYISTKTKIAYLNVPIELKDVFWNIPIIPYAKPCNGVIKKQMKFNSSKTEELDFIQGKLQNETYYEENIITSINNPTGRIKFKDIRKVSIGISKKDIMSYRSKKKSAFYNCFVLILRMKMKESFKEYHVKIFNTGKLEIPGIQSEESFQSLLEYIIETLQPHTIEKLCYKENTDETVLINSNFNCGYFINREALYDILKFKYNIQSIYDPCSYPGIQCKFYYNSDIGIQSGSQISEENKSVYKNIQQVSFMIFRTGSVLIVGKCDENVLFIIYDFLKIILTQEFAQIRQKNTKINENNVTTSTKEKRKKIRRKTILVTSNIEKLST